MLRRKRSVNPVVGTHNAPCVTVFHRVLERKHIHLTQSPLINLTIDRVPFELGVISNEMFRRDRHVPRLNTANKPGSEYPGKDRILRIAFEVPPTQRVPMQVNGWREQNIRSFDPAFIGEKTTKFL